MEPLACALEISQSVAFQVLDGLVRLPVSGPRAHGFDAQGSRRRSVLDGSGYAACCCGRTNVSGGAVDRRARRVRGVVRFGAAQNGDEPEPRDANEQGSSSRKPSGKGDKASDENMVLHSRRKPIRRDAAELLPFDIQVVSPPPRMLGRQMLQSYLGNGDVLEYDGSHYLVKRVIFHYQFKQGKFCVERKTVEVKSIARKSLEAFLSKLYRDS
ncbi:hypothetical protein FVE85_8776 [Porphyridium purpureum]|uniref:Uncharacterized protein n=1 Tax=Porphyridium purpureum TaxID=35688 RepID=A0A5J4YP79_PORPP|nr:hypothetical protein FVE85_8776 [Porphyridium purpureum]|eukprot:POR2776..scf296_7